MVNFTKQINNPFMYAALNLSKSKDVNPVYKFYESEIYAHMEIGGTGSQQIHDNYFLIQNPKGLLLTYKIEPHMMNVSLQHSRELMDITTIEGGSYTTISINSKLDIFISQTGSGNKGNLDSNANKTSNLLSYFRCGHQHQ